MPAKWTSCAGWNGIFSVTTTPTVSYTHLAAAPGFGLRTELTKRYTTYHDAAYYEDTTQLTDPAWEQLAASGQFSRLAFASFDFEHDDF